MAKEPVARISRTSRFSWDVELSCNGSFNEARWYSGDCWDYWTTFTERGAHRSAQRWIRKQKRKQYYASLPKETING